MLSNAAALGRPEVAAAQRENHWSADLVAGLYSSNRPSLNGPVFHLRYLVEVPAAAGLAFGARADFRDDAPGGGRIQALGAGVDVVLGMSEPVYVFGGLEGIANLTGGADANTGLEVAASLGMGGHVRPLPALLEIRYTVGPGWRLWAIGFGLGRTGVDRMPARAAAEASGGGLGLSNDRYRPSEGFRGYALAYEHLLGSAPGAAVRGSVGIVFVDFSQGLVRWDTGAVTFLLGLPVTAWSLEETLRVRLVPEVGGWLFSEPRSRAYPLLRVGPEMLLGNSILAVTGGLSASVAAGPAGMLRAVMWRLGARLAL